jgi:catechol 2,3-dioxygenase-like lactoylglutathione lyase family enzyme
VSEPAGRADWGSALTHILVVDELPRAVAFYRDVLGATIVREYGGTSAVLQLFEGWLLLVTGGPPTDDKPTVSFESPYDADRVSHSMTFRVPDCRHAHEVLTERGAIFLAPLIESDWEIRGFFRDPDGHLLEISEAKDG